MARKQKITLSPENARREMRFQILQARGANRRAWQSLAKWGRNDCGTLLYVDHERRERDRHMKAARRFASMLPA